MSMSNWYNGLMSKNPIAILGRWQPLHLGHQAALHALCDQFERVLIGVGSSNIIDYRNPFSLEDTIEMLKLALRNYANYRLVPIPDNRDEAFWCNSVEKAFGEIDLLISANPYVKAILNDRYEISHPAKFIPDEQRIPVSGTIVRRNLARGENWQELLPKEVTQYLIENKLDTKFRKEFGLSILALDTFIVE